jgi:hypothetical protein
MPCGNRIGRPFAASLISADSYHFRIIRANTGRLGGSTNSMAALRFRLPSNTLMFHGNGVWHTMLNLWVSLISPCDIDQATR